MGGVWALAKRVGYIEFYIQSKHIGEAIFLTGRKGGFESQRLARLTT